MVKYQGIVCECSAKRHQCLSTHSPRGSDCRHLSIPLPAVLVKLPRLRCNAQPSWQRSFHSLTESPHAETEHTTAISEFQVLVVTLEGSERLNRTAPGIQASYIEGI